MEQKYWEQFMKTGGVADYLGYKMEVYGHCHRENESREMRSIPSENEIREMRSVPSVNEIREMR